tara:strand:+ start:120 stop:560 length:441 start_codon:yes stop_codon:yes gene_type:complete
MPRRIRFDQIDDYVEERFNWLLRNAVLVADAQLKQGSPTDTGRLKASWQISENTADGQGQPPGEYGQQPTPPDRTNYSHERMGETYVVYNNLEYAEPVISGKNLPPSWLKAKPAGWRSKKNQIVQNYHLTVAKNVQNFIRDNAKDP